MFRIIKVFLEKIFNKRNIFYYLYYSIFCLGLVTMFFFVSRIKILAYFPIIWIGFGWSVTFFRSKLSLLENLLLGFIVFVSIYTVFSGLLILFDIPLSIITFSVFILLSLISFIYLRAFDKENINLLLSKWDIILCFIIGIAVIAKVFSIRGMITPNLSDEISHAYFSKLILETGKMPTFYSPGFHIIISLCSQLGGYDVVRQVLYLTNLISAYSGIPIYFFVRYVLKKDIGAIVTAGLFSLGYPLLSLFYFSGKNTFILGISALAFFMFVLFMYSKSHSKLLSVCSALSLFSLYIIHYPVAVFATIFYASFFIVDIKKGWKKNLLVGSGVLMGGVFMVILMLRYKPDIFNLNSNIGLDLGINYWLVLEEFFRSLKIHILKHSFNIFPLLLTIISVLGLGFTIANMLFRKHKAYTTLFLWTALSLILMVILRLLAIDSIYIIVETYYLLVFVYLYVYLSLGISVIYSVFKKFLPKVVLFTAFVLCFATVVILVGEHTYSRCVSKKEYNIVKTDDLLVFNWLDDNTRNSDKVLVNTYSIFSGFVFPSDSGGWITLFSDNMISAPFWDFNGKTTFENYKYYKNLVENPDDCIAKNYFIDNGYIYYFKGSVPLGESIGDKDRLISHGWILLYESGNSSVFKIPRCE